MAINKQDSALSYLDKDSNINIIRPKTIAKNVYLESEVGSIPAGSTLTNALYNLYNRPFKQLCSRTVNSSETLVATGVSGTTLGYGYIPICDLSSLDIDYTDYNDKIIVSIDKKLTASDFELTDHNTGDQLDTILTGSLFISDDISSSTISTKDEKMVLFDNATCTVDNMATGWNCDNITLPSRVYKSISLENSTLYLIFGFTASTTLNDGSAYENVFHFLNDFNIYIDVATLGTD